MRKEFWVALVSSDKVCIFIHHLKHSVVFLHVASIDCLNRYLRQSKKRCKLILIGMKVVILIEITWSIVVKGSNLIFHDELGGCWFFR